MVTGRFWERLILAGAALSFAACGTDDNFQAVAQTPAPPAQANQNPIQGTPVLATLLLNGDNNSFTVKGAAFINAAKVSVIENGTDNQITTGALVADPSDFMMANPIYSVFSLPSGIIQGLTLAKSGSSTYDVYSPPSAGSLPNQSTNGPLISDSEPPAGYYPEGMIFNGEGQVTMNGTYVIGCPGILFNGDNWTVNINGTLVVLAGQFVINGNKNQITVNPSNRVGLDFLATTNNNCTQ